LAGKGAGADAGREVLLVGLDSKTQVEEVRQQGAAALGVGTVSEVRLVCGGRVLREEETLGEAGVVSGGVVEVRVGEAAGMPVGCFGFGGQQQTVNELRLRVAEAEARHEAEARRHAEEKALLQAEVELLRNRSSAMNPALAGAAAARVEATVQKWQEAPSLAGVLVGRSGQGFQEGKVSSTTSASTLIPSSKTKMWMI
jgi:hypothetical protein